MGRPRPSRGPFAVGAILDVPLQDGVTLARAVVIAADETRFTVRLKTLFPGAEMDYMQDALGIVKVSDG